LLPKIAIINPVQAEGISMPVFRSKGFLRAFASGLILLALGALAPNASAQVNSAKRDKDSTNTPAASFDDPEAYCAAIRNVDRPGAKYTGPPVTAKMAATFDSTVSELKIGNGSSRLDWRCMDAVVLACVTYNSPVCEKQKTTVTASIAQYCRENPGGDTVPASIAGRASVEWRCKGIQPYIARRFEALDKRGFILSAWKAVRSIDTAQSPKITEPREKSTGAQTDESHCVGKSVLERIICAEGNASTLSGAITQVGHEFSKLIAGLQGDERERIAQSQRDWWRGRDAKCGVNDDSPLPELLAAKPCLLDQFARRTAELKSAATTRPPNVNVPVASGGDTLSRLRAAASQASETVPQADQLGEATNGIGDAGRDANERLLRKVRCRI
jgi:uncharacterized protein YecT (DUF1311 family)